MTSILTKNSLRSSTLYAVSAAAMFFLSFSIYKAYSPPEILSLIQKVGDLMKPMQKMMDRMEKVSSSGSFDVDFAAMMTEHHKGAINMTEVFLKSAKNAKLITMSQKMLEKQTQELKVLKDYIKQSEVTRLNEATGKEMLMEIMIRAMAEMQQIKISGDIETDYATLMIIHHQSGAEMAMLEVANGKNPNLQDMGARMAGDQEKEMNELKSWLQNKK